MAWWAPLIGGAISGLGSLFGGQAQGDAIGESNALQDKWAQKQYDWQRTMARHGLKFRVNDAKEAGISPLAALGANIQGSSPVQLMNTPDTSKGDMMANMGQDIGRAVSSALSMTGRAEEFEKEQLKNAKLQNKMLQAQVDNVALRLRTQPGSPPPTMGLEPLVAPGQGDGYVTEKPSQRTRSHPGQPGKEAGHVADLHFAHTGTGLAPIPSSDAKDRIEDQFIPEMAWAARNLVAPNFGMGKKPPKSLLKSFKGKYNDWEWSYTSQEWRPTFKKNWIRKERR